MMSDILACLGPSLIQVWVSEALPVLRQSRHSSDSPDSPDSPDTASDNALVSIVVAAVCRSSSTRSEVGET